MDDGQVTAGSLSATSTGNATATATGNLVVVAVGGGFGSTTNSSLTQTTDSRIGNNAMVSLGGGAASLSATGNATSAASDSAVSVSGVDVSVVNLSASTAGGVHAFVGDGTTFTGGSLNLSATGTQTPTVSNSFVSVTLLKVGVTTLTSTDSTTVQTYVGSLAGGGNPTSVTTTGAGGVSATTTDTSTPTATANFVERGAAGVRRLGPDQGDRDPHGPVFRGEQRERRDQRLRFVVQRARPRRSRSRPAAA